MHNPSIAQGPDGEYRVIVRSSNYVYRNGQFIATDPDNIVRTRNYLCDLDDNLGVTKMAWIDDTAVDPPVYYTLVRNMEDARLFWEDGYWWACGTSRQHRPDGTPKMALDRLEGNVAVERIILEGPDDLLCEKNWVPIIGAGGRTFLYDRFPAYTYTHRYNLWAESGVVPGVVAPNPPLRGGSQLIEIPGTPRYLSVTHEVTWEPDRHYWHRFVLHALDYAVIAYSEPFYFVGPGCEFAAGVVAKGDDFVVSFGHAESRALFATVPKKQVLESLS